MKNTGGFISTTTTKTWSCVSNSNSISWDLDSQPYSGLFPGLDWAFGGCLHSTVRVIGPRGVRSEATRLGWKCNHQSFIFSFWGVDSIVIFGLNCQTLFYGLGIFFWGEEARFLYVGKRRTCLDHTELLRAGVITQLHTVMMTSWQQNLRNLKYTIILSSLIKPTDLGKGVYVYVNHTSVLVYMFVL